MRSTALAALLALALVLPAAAQDVSSLGPAPRDAEGRFVNSIGPISHADFGVRFPFF